MNDCVFIGRMAVDPELRTTQNGISNCNFKIAVQRPYKDGNGERQADFIACVAWRQTAEYVARYMHKGDMIGVRGSLQNRSYTAQDGSKRYVSEIIVDEVQSCGSSQARDQMAQPAQSGTNGFTEVEDDGLPF